MKGRHCSSDTASIILGSRTIAQNKSTGEKPKARQLLVLVLVLLLMLPFRLLLNRWYRLTIGSKDNSNVQGGQRQSTEKRP